MRGNVYRQLPLYCFLEEEATSVPQREDPETYEKLVESNAKYLADMMKAENFQSGSDDMRENQETAVEKEKNRPEAHLSENEKPEEKTEESDRHLQEQQVTGEKKSSETEAIPTSKPEVSPVSGPTASPAVSSAASAQPALAQSQPAPVIDLAPEILADYDYLLNNFFIVDEDTATSAEQLDAAEFLANDLTVKKVRGRLRFLFITAIHRKLLQIPEKAWWRILLWEWETIWRKFLQKPMAIRYFT